MWHCRNNQVIYTHIRTVFTSEDVSQLLGRGDCHRYSLKILKFRLAEIRLDYQCCQSLQFKPNLWHSKTEIVCCVPWFHLIKFWVATCINFSLMAGLLHILYTRYCPDVHLTSFYVGVLPGLPPRQLWLKAWERGYTCSTWDGQDTCTQTENLSLGRRPWI